MHSFRPATHQYLIDVDQVLPRRAVNLTPYMPFCISQSPHPFGRSAPTWTFSTPCNLRLTPTCAQPFQPTYNIQTPPPIISSGSFHATSCISSCPVCYTDHTLQGHRMHHVYLQYARNLLRRIADEQSEIERLQQLHARQQQSQRPMMQPWQQRQSTTWSTTLPSHSYPTQYYTNPPSFHMVSEEPYNIPQQNSNINNIESNSHNRSPVANAVNFTDHPQSTQQLPPLTTQQQMHRFVSMQIVHILQYQHRLQLIRQQLEQQQFDQQHRSQNLQQTPQQRPTHNHIHFAQPHHYHHFQRQLPHSSFIHDSYHNRHHPHLFQTLIPDYLTRVTRQPPTVASTHNTAPNLQFVLARVGRTPMTQYRMINLYEENNDFENYETLLHITEQMGEVRIRGLSATEINSLPSYRYHEDSCGDENKEKFLSKNKMDDDTYDVNAERLGIVEESMEELEMKEEDEMVKKKADGEAQMSCVVCLCDFEVQQWLKVMPCLHEFHADCISKWLKENNTCPLCRSDIAEKLRKTSSIE